MAELHLFPLIMGLLGGLAVFLFGMEQMTDALKSVAGAVLAQTVQSVSPAYPELEGAARLAAETPRQIANAHTAFNVLNTLIFIGFTGPLAALVVRLLPKKPEVLAELAQPRYLQEVYLATPALALDAVRRETIRLGEQVAQIGQEVGPAVTAGAEENQAVELIQREYYFAKKIAKEVVRELEASIEDPILEDELA